MKRHSSIVPEHRSSKHKDFTRAAAVLLACAMTVGFMGCKKDGGDDEDEQREEAAEVNSVKLAKKWPAGQSVTFSKSISIKREVSGQPTRGTTQERETTYLMIFGAGASLATTIPLKIVGQKMNNTFGGRPLFVFEGKAESDDDEDDDEDDMDEDEDEDEDEDGGRKAPKNPMAEIVKRSVLASLGSSVNITTDATGAITKVDGVQGVKGVHGKVLRGVPAGLLPFVGGMFSDIVFMEAPMFHAGLTGEEVMKDASWKHSEKGMLMLNWRQDFDFTSTFTGMEEWQGKQVATFKITGEISGSTTKPSAVTINPGGTFTGKALYSIDLGILVERTISGSFVAMEGQTTVSNTFTQSFKVASLKGADDDEDLE